VDAPVVVADSVIVGAVGDGLTPVTCVRSVVSASVSAVVPMSTYWPVLTPAGSQPRRRAL
jgi:hypothetical protein